MFLLFAVLIFSVPSHSQSKKVPLDEKDRTTYLDMRSPSEIMNDFYEKTKNWRSCSENKECVLRRAGCQDFGVNKRYLKKFNSLSGKLQIGCVGTTKCETVTCSEKVCLPLKCQNSSI